MTSVKKALHVTSPGDLFNVHFRNHKGWRLIDEWLGSKGFGS
jgi:hypothetical protein